MDEEEEAWMTTVSELIDVSILLPSQVYLEAGHKSCRDLIGCLLEGALHDLRLPPSRTRDYALRWIEAGTSGDFTFNDVCQYLGLDAEAVRLRALAGLVAQTPRNLNRGDRGKLG